MEIPVATCGIFNEVPLCIGETRYHGLVLMSGTSGVELDEVIEVAKVAYGHL